MYRKQQPDKNYIAVNKSYEGETIEEKVRRITNNGEPIKDGAPLVYQERAEGVNPDMDIRSDRWEYAIDAMDKVTKATRAKRTPVVKWTKNRLKRLKKLKHLLQLQ